MADEGVPEINGSLSNHQRLDDGRLRFVQSALESFSERPAIDRSQDGVSTADSVRGGIVGGGGGCGGGGSVALVRCLVLRGFPACPNRRSSAEAILSGRVSVNGSTVTRPSAAVAEGDVVEVDGAPPKESRNRSGGCGEFEGGGHLHLIMNKPTGCLCERRRGSGHERRSKEGDGIGNEVGRYAEDASPRSAAIALSGKKGGRKPELRPTVYDILPQSASDRPSLATVGRLDADTTGALLFTTDGMLGNALSNPAFKVSKLYRATLRRPAPLTEDELQDLAGGVRLPHRRGAIVSGNARNAEGCPPGTVDLCITGGYNRQVKHMLRIVGRPLKDLERLEFAGLRCGEDLPRGGCRELTETEVESLYSLARSRLDGLNVC